MKAYHQVVQRLPPWMQESLNPLCLSIGSDVREIRIRVNEPIQLVTGKSLVTVPYPERISQEQLEEVLFTLCGSSLYAHEAELAQGFLQLEGGHRVGVGGKYIHLQTGQTVLQKVLSLNIRVARFQTGSLPLDLMRILQEHFSVLVIAGEPGSGKTTLLRSMTAFLPSCHKICAVIDERGEIFPAGEDLPAGCDYIQGLNKIQGIEMALRTLGPQILLVDELVSMEETRLLEAGVHAGVDLVLTMHASTLQEMEQKLQIQYLLERKLLYYACVLQGREHPGQIREVKCYC